MDKLSSHIHVIALPEFIKCSKKLIGENELAELIAYLQQQPTKGDVISGTGGARKLRWAAKGKGKRGGMRVIYYYFVSELEIYLISAYAKNKQTDLSAADKKAVKELIYHLSESTSI